MGSSAAKKRRDYDLIGSCWHEASHAIIATYNYFYVYNIVVSITSNVDYYMPSDGIFDDVELKKLVAILQVQLLYAGSVGELLYYKEACGSLTYPKHLMKDWGYDIEHSSAIIRSNDLAIPGKRTFLFKKQVKYEVSKILLDHWDDVRLLSHLLYKKKKLSYQDLKHILTRKSYNKEFWRSRFRGITEIYGKEIGEGMHTVLSDERIKDILLEDNIVSI